VTARSQHLQFSKIHPKFQTTPILLQLDPPAVLKVLNGRRDELRRALLRRTHHISSAVLQDFDWQLKLSLSSSQISSLQTPLLSLSLDVREGGATRPVTMEMNREELNTLISSLEAANKQTVGLVKHRGHCPLCPLCPLSPLCPLCPLCPGHSAVQWRSCVSSMSPLMSLVQIKHTWSN
uniref:COMM domain containing 8 n=1 Tax=Sphaeramia orbicularis TaxID=375764 RepID=A0A672YH28_9TELE